MKKSFAIGLILLLAGVIGMVITFTGDDDLLDFGTTSIDMGETVAAGAITDVQVKGSSMDVEIERGSGADILVKLEGRASEKFLDEIDLKVNTDGSTLHIETEMPKGFSIGINIIDVKVRIELPEKTWKDVNVDVGSGNIALSDVAADNVELDAGSGNIETVRVTGGSIQLHSGSGNQRLTHVKAADAITLELGSGNLTVDTFEAAELAFKATSGNVKLQDGTAKVTGSTGSGNIHYETAQLTQDVRLKAGSGNVNIELDEEPSSLKVDFRTGSGDSDVDWESFWIEMEHEGDISGQFGDGALLLEVTTGSGDIELERR